jgi:hypothetical protein
MDDFSNAASFHMRGGACRKASKSMPFDDYRYVVEYESAEGDVITRYYRGWQTAYAFIGNYAVWLIRRLSDRVVIAQSRPLGTQTGSTGKQEEAR